MIVIPKRVRYAHIRQHRLEYTIAYLVERVGDKLEVEYGVAQCNQRDSFIKAIGRTIAFSRLATPGRNNYRRGSLTLNDSPDVSVSRAIQEAFETARRADMSDNGVIPLETVVPRREWRVTDKYSLEATRIG